MRVVATATRSRTPCPPLSVSTRRLDTTPNIARLTSKARKFSEEIAESDSSSLDETTISHYSSFPNLSLENSARPSLVDDSIRRSSEVWLIDPLAAKSQIVQNRLFSTSHHRDLGLPHLRRCATESTCIRPCRTLRQRNWITRVEH